MANINLAFDNIAGLANYCAEVPESFRVDNSKYISSSDSKSANFETAAGLMVGGCLDIVKQFTDKLKNLQRGPVSRVRPVASVVGSVANVPAVLAGLPMSMIKYEKYQKTSKSKIINIYYNACYNWNIKPDQIVEVGSYVLRLAENSERAGYQTNIFCCLAAEESRSRCPGSFRMAVKVKRAGDRFNLAKLSYCFAHPSFLRRHGFVCMYYNNCSPSSYHTVDFSADGLPSGAIVINGHNYINSPADILKLTAGRV